MLTTRGSDWMGASAAATASWYRWSLTESVSLLKIRSKFEVVAADDLPPLSSSLVSCDAWKDSSLLRSGPPLVRFPPWTANTTDAASSKPEAASVAQRNL